MTIDTIDINSTYGLKLTQLGDYYNLAARKQVLNVTAFGANDIKLKSNKATLTLMGRYADAATLITQIKAFETLLKSYLKHDFSITEHSLNFTGTCTNGFQSTTYLHKGIAVIKLTITITE